MYSQGSLNSRRPSISHTLSDYRRDDHIRRGTALNGDGDLTGLGVLGRRGTGDGLSLATSGKGFGSFVTNGPLSPMKDRFARRGLSLLAFLVHLMTFHKQIQIKRERHTGPGSLHLVRLDLQETATRRRLLPVGLARSTLEAGRLLVYSLLEMGGEEDARLELWRMLEERRINVTKSRKVTSSPNVTIRRVTNSLMRQLSLSPWNQRKSRKTRLRVLRWTTGRTTPRSRMTELVLRSVLTRRSSTATAAVNLHPRF